MEGESLGRVEDSSGAGVRPIVRGMGGESSGHEEGICHPQWMPHSVFLAGI